jgi:hypothetical protein
LSVGSPIRWWLPYSAIMIGLPVCLVVATEEFGAPVPGQAAQRYGWLGGKYRSSDSTTAHGQ